MIRFAALCLSSSSTAFALPSTARFSFMPCLAAPIACSAVGTVGTVVARASPLSGGASRTCGAVASNAGSSGTGGGNEVNFIGAALFPRDGLGSVCAADFERYCRAREPGCAL